MILLTFYNSIYVHPRVPEIAAGSLHSPASEYFRMLLLSEVLYVQNKQLETSLKQEEAKKKQAKRNKPDHNRANQVHYATRQCRSQRNQHPFLGSYVVRIAPTT